MELYQGKWCISGSELIQSPENPDGLISLPYYKKLVRARKINVVRRACRFTPALIEFDSLPMRYQEQYLEQLGYDPREEGKESNSIARSFEPDEEARKFFYDKFKLPNGEVLSDGAKEEYSTNADLLRTIHKMANNMRGSRVSRSGSLHGRWEILAERLRTLDRARFPHSLPTNPVRLREKVNRYLKEGPASLIHRGYGNKVAEKLTEESRRWLLARWSNPVERATSVEHLFELYNMEAPIRGWEPLKSVSTIRNYLFSPEVKHIWWGVRYGHIKAKQKFSLQHSTTMPTMRDSLWYSDGTKLNFSYLNENGKIAHCGVYEVMDAYSEVLLGYSFYDKSEDNVAQYQAYKMAIQFAGHKPYQITYDNQGGHKKLESGEFLRKMTHLAIRTQPYNGRSKTIENAFGRFQTQIMKRRWFYSGQNITAHTLESRIFEEHIDANYRELPSKLEAQKKYVEDRMAWNNAPHPKTGVPRIEMYRSSQNPKAPAVHQWDMVNLFWITRPDPIALTGYGLSFTEKKVKYDYLVYVDGKPDFEWHRNNIDRKFYVKYDPEDLSLIYLYVKNASGELRFEREAMPKITIARGKQEQTSEDRMWIEIYDKANKTATIQDRDKAIEFQEEFEMSPERFGQVPAGIPGLTKGQRPSGMGRLQKVISNYTPADDDEEINIYDVM